MREANPMTADAAANRPTAPSLRVPPGFLRRRAGLGPHHGRRFPSFAIAMGRAAQENPSGSGPRPGGEECADAAAPPATRPPPRPEEISMIVRDGATRRLPILATGHASRV